MSDTPQHDKLQGVHEFSQAIGEFLEWAETQGWHLGEWRKINSFGDELMHPVGLGKSKILAQYFDIDLVILEEEKLAMLEQIRAAN